jgi:prevent-host-death family protein
MDERRIGVRELRQHASRYLRRVASGESFTVTDRGDPVAQLVPIMADSVTGSLITRGELVLPERPAGVLDGHLPAPLDLGFSASDELQRLRDEERW